jgi:Holliday junction resolvasome RuvABC endonuclease subunit
MCGAISRVDGSGLTLSSVVLRSDLLQRLHKVEDWMAEELSRIPNTEEVWVFLESPIVFRSRTSTIALAQVSGAAIAGVGSHPRAKLMMVNNMTWKADQVKDGHAKKPEISRHLHDTWLNAWDACKGNPDLIDACVINRYGAAILKRRSSVRVTRKVRVVKR